MSVNRGNVGRAAICVATGGRRGVETGVRRGSAFRQRLWDGKVFLQIRLTDGPERDVRVDNRTYQVLIPIWRLTSAQVKSRGCNNANRMAYVCTVASLG